MSTEPYSLFKPTHEIRFWGSKQTIPVMEIDVRNPDGKLLVTETEWAGELTGDGIWSITKDRGLTKGSRTIRGSYVVAIGGT